MRLLYICVFLVVHMPENKRSIFKRFMGYTIPFLMVFYVLSTGPFYATVLNSRLIARHTSEPVESDSIFSNENLVSLYALLFWAGQKNQFIDELLFDYQYFCFEIMYAD